MSHVFALIDCNNFFASCEKVFRPDIRHRPVVVLSNNDGCVVARSNEVKALGVPMGIPLFKVKGLLQQHDTAIFSANFALYGDMAQRISNIMCELAPKIEIYSIDESFIDLSVLSVDDYEIWAAQVRRRILKETGIPVSVGIGPSKTLAKAAATYAKKQTTSNVFVACDKNQQEKLLRWLPIEDIWGIGRRLTPKMKEYGFSTAAQLVTAEDTWLLHQLTIKGLTTVRELRGETLLPLESGESKRKSIGRSRSFGHSVRAIHQLESAVATFSTQAAVKLRSQDCVAGAVVTYLRTSRHAANSRNVATLTKLAEPSADTGTIITAALKGLEDIYDADFAYQKAGILLLDITPHEAWQLSLLYPDANRDKKMQLMQTIDKLNRHFGPHTIWHASEDVGRAGWHSKRQHRSPAYTTNWQDIPILSV